MHRNDTRQPKNTECWLPLVKQGKDENRKDLVVFLLKLDLKKIWQIKCYFLYVQIFDNSKKFTILIFKK